MEILFTGNYQPDIIVGGFRVGEPVVALTGMLVSMCAIYCWKQLRKPPFVGSEPNYFPLFRHFFLFLGLSTFFGAIIGHAFLYAFQFAWKLPGWVLGMVAASAMAQVSIIRSEGVIEGGTQKWLSRFNIFCFFVGLVWLFSTLWFPVVEMQSAICFLGFVLPLEIRLFLKDRRSGSKELILGVSFLIVAVIPHIMKWSLGIWFCYFDLGHLAMVAAVYYFYCAAAGWRVLERTLVMERGERR